MHHVLDTANGYGINAKSGTNEVILDGSSFLVSGLHSLLPPPHYQNWGVFSSVPEAQGKDL
jgi:hypothetical protein